MVNYISIAVSLRVQRVLSLFLNCSFLCYGVNKRRRLHTTAEGGKQKILPNQRNFVVGIYIGSFCLRNIPRHKNLLCHLHSNQAIGIQIIQAEELAFPPL